MNLIPDCTLVTGCFCMKKYHNEAKDINDVVNSIKTLLEMPCYIIFNGDNITIPLMKEIRNKLGLTHLSIYCEFEVEKLWSFQFLDTVKKNREIYWPTKDKRTSSETHLITCNKFDFVLKAIESNPFNTSKFCWIDAFLGENFNRVCENYNSYTLLHIMRNITDKFHIQIHSVVDKKFIQPENKKEYYNEYRSPVCGGLFSCGKEIGLRILVRLKEIVEKTTLMGYGHGEEMFYLEVLDEFYDDIVRSYGNYNNIFDNFIKTKKNILYILNVIIKNYISNKYYKEAFDCSKKLLEQIESYELFVEWETYLSILYEYYISSYYYKPKIAIETCEKINKLRELNPYIKNEYNKNKGFYDSQLEYVKYL